MSIPTTGATVTTALSPTATSPGPLTGSHTTDANTNLLVVMVGYGNPAAGAHATVVTFGGVALTELGTVVQGNSCRTDIWYLASPSIETATVSVGEFGDQARLGWTAINVIGANVAGPIFGTHIELSATAEIDASVTLSSATDELCLVSSVSSNNSRTLTAQSGTTELSNQAHSAQGVFAAGSKTGASTVDLGFDLNATANVVVLGVPIIPVAGAAGVLETYGWRLRADDGVEGSAGAAFLAAEDVAIVVGANGAVDLDTNFRIRQGLDETNVGDPAASAVQIRAKLNGGTAFSVNATSTYVRMSASGHSTDGAPTTDHGLAAPAGAFVAGEILETTGLSGSIDLTQNGYGIVEGCVQARSAELVSGDTLEFGLRYGGVDYFPGAIALTVEPPPPTGVTIGAVGDTTLGITWTDPAPSNVVIRPYYKKAVDSEWIPEGALPIGTEAHTFGDLTPLVVGTSYDVGVAAYDSPLESAIVYVTQGTTGADREAHVTAFELEVETAPRTAIVTAFEFEITESAARKAHVTAFEMQAYDAAQGDPVASLGRIGLSTSPIGLGI